jgi:hypothetical protein
MGPLEDDPLTLLQEGAVNQHEMYISWVAAGFTEAQALDLLKAVITTLIRAVAE